MVAEASRYPTAIQDVSRSPPSVAAIAGVAVASKVWSTAAMNIGKNTARKRFRNSARETVAGSASGFILNSGTEPELVRAPSPNSFALGEFQFFDKRACRRRLVPADELHVGPALRVARLDEDDHHERRCLVGQHHAEHLGARPLAQLVHQLQAFGRRQIDELAGDAELRVGSDVNPCRTGGAIGAVQRTAAQRGQDHRQEDSYARSLTLEAPQHFSRSLLGRRQVLSIDPE